MQILLFLALLSCGSFAYESYDESQMLSQFSAAMDTVGKILNTTRHPQFAADVPHTYEDKYTLAEFLTNTALAAELNALSAMGLKSPRALKMREWVSQGQAVSVGLRAKQSCAFIRKEDERVSYAGETYNGGSTREKFYIVTNYFYLSSYSWQFLGYSGTASSAQDSPNTLVLDSRNYSYEVKTTSASNPSGCETRTLPFMDMDLTWLFKNLDTNNNPQFVINRIKSLTPRRNKQVDDAFSFFDRLNAWSKRPSVAVPGFRSDYLQTPIFVPVIPLFENNTSCVSLTTTSPCTPQVVLSPADLLSFLNEQKSSLQAAAAEAGRELPRRANSSAEMSEVEAFLSVVFDHHGKIAVAYELGVNSIEGMLHSQLVAAIGKEVSPHDFGEYIRFNNQRLFKPAYKPQDLSYNVRRPDHSPEGVVELLQNDASLLLPFPVQTIVRVDRSTFPMNTTIGGTTISLRGDRYLHAATFYQFAGQDQLKLQLSARARQFSSFVLLVGVMLSGNEFRADIGIIVKDKDDLIIPLLLETIPASIKRDDAIESLSPQQRQFVKAFRSMQLSSTLFAFSIIQIKPQLEKLMKLPEDSLTKEIELTQDLMRLFLEYQLPAELLSFQGAEDLLPIKKVEYVQKQVSLMNNFIEKEKQLQIAEAQKVAKAGAAGSTEPQLRTSLESSAQSSSYFSSASARDTGSSNVLNTTTKQVALGKVVDYTTIPAALDARVLAFDGPISLRPTVFKPQGSWTRKSQKGLLSAPTNQYLDSASQVDERQKAFDLLDILSKTGIMEFDGTEFHVVIGSTQSFDQTLIDTVIMQNKNPIDHFERSSLLVATTVFGLPAVDLVAPSQVPRLAGFSPTLFPNAVSPDQ